MRTGLEQLLRVLPGLLELGAAQRGLDEASPRSSNELRRRHPRRVAVGHQGIMVLAFRKEQITELELNLSRLRRCDVGSNGEGGRHDEDRCDEETKTARHGPSRAADAEATQRVYCSIGTPSYISSTRRICVSRL